MKLDCVWDTEAGKNDYPKIKQELLERFSVDSIYGLSGQVFEEHEKSNLYARNVHTGKIKSGIKLSALEVAFICDHGYSFFGGSSNVFNDGSFRVEIWTD